MIVSGNPNFILMVSHEPLAGFISSFVNQSPLIPTLARTGLLFVALAKEIYILAWLDYMPTGVKAERGGGGWWVDVMATLFNWHFNISAYWETLH